MADTINNTPELSDQELLRCAKIATPCYDLDSWKRELQMMRAAIAADRARRAPRPMPVAKQHPIAPPNLANQGLIELANLEDDLIRYGRGYRSDAIRAIVSHWDNHPVSPESSPADGEVAELAAWLRERGQERETLHLPGAELSKQLRTAPFLLTRAADLLERLSPPQLVPVSERLPGPEDCDAQGRCWHFAPAEGFGAAGWSFYQGSEDDTHWLPAHALPLPSNTSRSI